MRFDFCRMAWRNIWRNRRRSLLSAAAVGFAVTILCFVMALQQGSYASMIKSAARNQSGHLQVQREGYWPDLQLWKSLQHPEPLLSELDQVPHVIAVAPRIEAAALISHEDRTFGAAVLGIDPDREPDMSTLADITRQGRFLTAADTNGVVLGATLARNLGVSVGQEIVFLGQGSDGSLAAGRLMIVGLYDSGIPAMDRSSIVAHLAAVQEAFALEQRVTGIAILLDHDRHRLEARTAIESILAQAGRDDAAVLGWPVLLPGLQDSIQLDWTMGLIFFFIMVMVVGFGIANTFLMAFLERRREFGTLLSLGMPPRKISWLVYAESVLLTLIGVGAGLLVGIPLVLHFKQAGISFGEKGGEIMAQYGMDPRIYPELNALVFAWGIGMVLVVALVLAAYPAIKAAGLKPVEAMRA